MSGTIFDCNRNKFSEIKTKNIYNMKILHAPENIAGTMYDNVTFLKACNIYARSIVTSTNYLQYESDYYLEKNLFKSNEDGQRAYRKLLVKLMEEYNIFHFYFGQSFLDNREDLKILKENGKKIVMSYLGSDCRIHTENIKYNPYYKNICHMLNIDESRVIENLEKCSQYIDCAIAGPIDAHLNVSKYFKFTYINRLGLDLDYYRPVKSQNKIPVIVHAPTARAIKGSEYVFTAINNLRNRFDFDFKVIENTPYKEAKKIYEQADLVIDQLILGEYGRLACECMAMGKPVICYYNEHYKQFNGIEDIPIINANPDTIERVIGECLSNLDQIKDIGIKSRQYVEKYHDIRKNVENLLQIYSQL